MSHFCHSLSTKAGWAFTSYNNEPMQDFGPKMGGYGGGWADATQWAFTRHFTVSMLDEHNHRSTGYGVDISVVVSPARQQTKSTPRDNYHL